MRSDRAARTEAELVPIVDRLRSMQIFRLVIAGVVVAFASLIGDAPTGLLLLGSAAFLVVSVVGELLWRAFRTRGLPLFGAMLIIDGLFLAWVTWTTGAGASPLRHLVVLHLIAVALLASYRTGLKLAMWHSLLLLLVFELHQRGAEPAVGVGVAAAPGTSFEQLVTFIAVFWLVVLSTATFSAVNERELRRRRFDLEALAQLAAALEEVAHPAAVGEVLVGRLADTFAFGRAVVLAPGPDQELRVLATFGVDAATVGLEVAPGASSVVDLVASSRQTLLVERLDVEADGALLRLLPDARNVIIVPLVAEGGVQGVVLAEHALRSGSRIERRVVAAVERFASHGALSLRNAALLEAMERMASTDALTGIANRRTFEATAERELARAARNNEPVALVLVDIDNFKRLNDTYGHREGDKVLRKVAEVLQATCRSFDTPARYGGEEFAIVLPGCDLRAAVEAAERMRRAVASVDHEARVTVSAGVAVHPRNGADVDALVRSADAALYESKRSGRDRVSAATPPAAVV